MRVFSKYKLLAIKGEIGLLYHKGKLYTQNLKIEKTPQYLCSVPLSKTKKWMVKIRLLERLLRLEPRVAASVEDGFIFSCAGIIYHINVDAGMLSEELKLRKGMNNPLTFTHTLRGTILFGEYFSNNNNEEVCVYERTNKGWKKVYSFPPSTIYHIHGIISAREGIYILTGDDDLESAIWFTDDYFQNVKMIIGGDQKYRACVAFQFEDGLVYATDTPLKKNELRFIKKNENGDWESKSIYDMPGPCIYGTQIDGCMYFATSVEPDARYEDTMRYRITYKLGEGVKDRNTHLIMMNQEGIITEVAKLKKDIWPMLLFQFGNIQFPDTVENDVVFATPISVKKYDGMTIRIE